jgi:hypothetical protein
VSLERKRYLKIKMSINMEEPKKESSFMEKLLSIFSTDPKELYDTLNESLTSFAESFIRKLCFWEKDDKRIGGILRFAHYCGSCFLILIYIINHTVYTSYWLLLVFYITYLFIFIHHLICGGCIITKVEQRLLKDNQCFIDPILEVFHIPTADDVSNHVFIMLSCFLMAILTIEMIGRTIDMIGQTVF